MITLARGLVISKTVAIPSISTATKTSSWVIQSQLRIQAKLTRSVTRPESLIARTVPGLIGANAMHATVKGHERAPSQNLQGRARLAQAKRNPLERLRCARQMILESVVVRDSSIIVLGPTGNLIRNVYSRRSIMMPGVALVTKLEKGAWLPRLIRHLTQGYTMLV